MKPAFPRRAVLGALAALSLLAGSAPALAQTPIKFQLDWRFEGPAAFFLHPVAKGHFKAEGLQPGQRHGFCANIARRSICCHEWKIFSCR